MPHCDYLQLSFRRFHMQTSSYKLYFTRPKSKISKTLPRNSFLLKITTQQLKCINLNIEHLRLKFLIIKPEYQLILLKCLNNFYMHSSSAEERVKDRHQIFNSHISNQSGSNRSNST